MQKRRYAIANALELRLFALTHHAVLVAPGTKAWLSSRRLDVIMSFFYDNVMLFGSVLNIVFFLYFHNFGHI